MPNCLNTQQPNRPAHLAIYFQLIQKYGIYLPMSRWEIVTVMSKKESPCDLSITGAYLFMEATPGFEPGSEGFADPCLTTWLCRQVSIKNGAGDGARTRFRHPTNGRPFAGALPNLSSHAPSTPVEAAGPLSSENPSPARENRSIKNGAGDGARTRFRHPTNGPPFAGALPNLSLHAPSAPVEAAGPLSRRKILLLHGKPVNKKWSGRRGSNPLPPPWQGGALPDELRPQMVPPVGIEPTTRGFSVRCSTN